MTTGSYWLLWDGGCGFCRRVVGWVQSHDREGVFQITPYQEAPSPPMTPELYARCRHAVQVVCADGTTMEAGRAVGFVLERIGWRRLGRVLTARPVAPVTEWGYRFIARHRGVIGRVLFGRSCSDR